MKIYISGQISDLPYEEVVKLFGQAETELQAKEYKPISPLNNGLPADADWNAHIVADIELLLECDAIYLLTNWENSKGAKIERHIAELTGKKIFYQQVPEFVAIKEAIFSIMGVTFSDITGNSRNRNIFYARTIFAFLSREKDITLQRIADEMKHHHTTIIYYLRKFDDDVKYNSKFRELFNGVQSELKSKNLRDSVL